MRTGELAGALDPPYDGKKNWGDAVLVILLNNQAIADNALVAVNIVNVVKVVNIVRCKLVWGKIPAERRFFPLNVWRRRSG